MKREKTKFKGDELKFLQKNHRKQMKEKEEKKGGGET